MSQSLKKKEYLFACEETVAPVHWPMTDKDRLTKPNSHPSFNDSTQNVYGAVFIKKHPAPHKKFKF